MKPSNPLQANVHSIETFGAFDGPGIRYVVFLQGCPFQCQYCHNRDTWSTASNKLMTSDDILDDYMKYRGFYKKGGLTVSGGEPLLQLNFLIDLFKKAKDRGIHTCLDTSAGCFNLKQIDLYRDLLEYTDLVLLDLKHIDADKHAHLTGQSNQTVLDFARFLDEIRKPTIIRHVLVPTMTDDPVDLLKLRNFIDTLTNIVDIEVLPYHTKGIEKWKALGYTYPIPEINEPNQESIDLAEAILKSKYVFYT